jgi:hypothetical protein
MITCPNCNHQNPDGALQCEACYTPLPAMATCPACHTPVRSDASFCGQCGADLREVALGEVALREVGSSASETISSAQSNVESNPASAMKTQNFLVPESGVSSPDVVENDPGNDLDLQLPDLVAPEPLVEPDPVQPEPIVGVSEGDGSADNEEAAPPVEPAAAPPVEPVSPPPPAAPRPPQATQLQTLSARLRQVQTNALIEIPRQLSVVRIGKPNNQTPPDIDVSGFPDSEVVSRIHANLLVEGDVYFIEDVGSSNGTYVNGLPLAAGNRHRLRPGDRIALGKGDKVSFVFETAS